MALLYVLVAACAGLLATCGSGSPIAPSETAAPPPGGRTFKVMTFNIQHGIDGTQQYNLQRAIDAIARVEPDLVGLQEVTRNHSSYRCDDQPAQITEGLRRATGRPWYHAYVQAWFADRSCAERGLGDGPATEGVALIAPEPISSVAQLPLFNSRVALAARVLRAGDVPVIVTHLANSAQRLDERVRQVAQLGPWASAQGMPHLVIGDLNAEPTAPEIEPLMRAYKDAWAEAQAAGTVRGVARGATRGSRRVDYVLFRPEGALRLEWVETVDTAALLGIAASDHNAVVASFRLP